MKKIRENLPMIIRGIVVAILFVYSYLFQYIPLFLFHIDLSTLSGNIRMAVLFSVFSEVSFLFLLLIIYRRDLIKEAETYFHNFKENFSIGFKSWFTGLFIMMISNAILSFVFHSKGANNEELVRTMLSSFPAIMILDVSLFAPVVEEIVFRKTLKDIFHNKWIYVALSFLLFGLAHVASSATSLVDWLYIIPYGTLGGFFAYADYETDTIFTSIVFHMIHNTMVVLLVFLVL